LLGSRLDTAGVPIPPAGTQYTIRNHDKGRHMCVYCGLTGMLSRIQFCCSVKDCKIQWYSYVPLDKTCKNEKHHVC
jgi:hypothetical protein